MIAKGEVEAVMTTQDREEIVDYAEQSREFLSRARAYLSEGDLHQASEKAWAAAAHMAKAVAVANELRYDRHSDFSVVIDHVWRTTGQDQLRSLRAIANDLHGNLYRRKRFLERDVITADIQSVGELLDLLEPLTE